MLMKYELKTVQENIDIIKLSEEEYNGLNSTFRDVLKTKGLGSAEMEDMKKLLIISSFNRVEFMIEKE